MNQMLPPINPMDILFPACGIVFTAWPILIVAPLERRKHILFNMAFVWFFLAAVRVVLLFNPTPNLSFQSMLIPEPLNTTLFLASGLFLGLVAYVKQRRKSNHVERVLRADVGTTTTKRHPTELTQLLEMSPTEFEETIADLLRSRGHTAKRTSAIGDHGVDVVAQSKTGQKWVIQCKRWRGAVGEPVVRDFYGVMHHEKADKGFIITTGTFTPQAENWAKGKPIVLLNGDQLVTALRRTRTWPSEERSSLKKNFA